VTKRIVVQSQPGQIVHKTLFRKNASQKRAGGVAQGVDPSSNSSTAKKPKKDNAVCQYVNVFQNNVSLSSNLASMNLFRCDFFVFSLY
jgi:hypothetical protein